jgi:hypothetical protein
MIDRALFALAASVSLFACSVAGEQPLGTSHQAGTDQVFVARPDPRDCFPALPYCGGKFMYQITRPATDLCNDELPFAGYVTRVVVREDDGTLTEIDPPCDQPLPGRFEEDPMYPGFNMFVYLPYVG